MTVEDKKTSCRSALMVDKEPKLPNDDVKLSWDRLRVSSSYESLTSTQGDHFRRSTF
jgi:hypothetical protein